MTDTLKAEISKLSVEEKRELAAEILSDIADCNDDDEVPEWHKEILDQRIAAYEKNPDQVVRWEQIKRAVREEHGR